MYAIIFSIIKLNSSGALITMNNNTKANTNVITSFTRLLTDFISEKKLKKKFFIGKGISIVALILIKKIIMAIIVKHTHIYI
jgi:hypothetical protein